MPLELANSPRGQKTTPARRNGNLLRVTCDDETGQYTGNDSNNHGNSVANHQILAHLLGLILPPLDESIDSTSNDADDRWDLALLAEHLDLDHDPADESSYSGKATQCQYRIQHF